VTPGFVGADLKALAREAGMLAVSRIVDTNPGISGGSNLIRDFSNGIAIGDSRSNDSKAGKEVQTMTILPPVSASLIPQEEVVFMSAGSAEVDVKAEFKATSSEVVLDGEERQEKPCIEKIDLEQPLIPLEVGVITPLIPSSSSSPLLTVYNQTEMETDLLNIVSGDSSAAVAVKMSDFLSAAKSVQPTAKREGFAVVPDVTWGKINNTYYGN
jgi:SpoVK/Ycf46/Vps4 family AAA+-type ATPase